MCSNTVFLLSPAHCGGRRAATLFSPGASSELAAKLQDGDGAPLGEVFSYLSGLYFRGKLSYARTFGRPPPGTPPALVITAGRGLMPANRRVGLPDIEGFSTVPVDPGDVRYTAPLQADLARLRARLPTECRIILLGSIATPKYVELLLSVFPERLCFPKAFVGTGDMARGAILLRAVKAGMELAYAPAADATRSLAGGR